MPWEEAELDEEAKAVFEAAKRKREEDAGRMLMDDELWSNEQLAEAFSGSVDPWEYVWVDFEGYGGRILPTKKFEPEPETRPVYLPMLAVHLNRVGCYSQPYKADQLE
jgi:hypothetical protein